MLRVIKTASILSIPKSSLLASIYLTSYNGAIAKENPVMRIASVIARYLAGVIFLVFGLNGFLNFIPLPPPGGIAGQFMGALYLSPYLWVIFCFHRIAVHLPLLTPS